MQYADGKEVSVGDIVWIDGKWRGVVIASIDRGEYSRAAPRSEWSHLAQGVLIDTDFGGIVHYQSKSTDRLQLVERAS